MSASAGPSSLGGQSNIQAGLAAEEDLLDKYTIDYNPAKPDQLSVTWYVPKNQPFPGLNLQPSGGDIPTLMLAVSDLSLAASTLRNLNTQNPIANMTDAKRATALKGKTAFTIKTIMDCQRGVQSSCHPQSELSSNPAYTEALTVSVTPNTFDGSRVTTAKVSEAMKSEDSRWRAIDCQMWTTFEQASERLAAIQNRALQLNTAEVHGLPLNCFDSSESSPSMFDPLLTNWRPANQGLTDDLNARAVPARSARVGWPGPPYTAHKMTPLGAPSQPSAGPSNAR